MHCGGFFLTLRLVRMCHCGKTFFRAFFTSHEDLPVRDKQHQQLYVTVSLKPNVVTCIWHQHRPRT